METEQEQRAEYEWLSVAAEKTGGVVVLPESAREDFYRHVHGEPVDSQREWSGHGAPEWRPPYGKMAMSPGLGLKTVCEEFNLAPGAVSYAGVWIADDTDGMPGGHPEKHPDFTCTYQILSVRLSRQILHVLDGGVKLVPVLLETLPERAGLLTAHEHETGCLRRREDFGPTDTACDLGAAVKEHARKVVS